MIIKAKNTTTEPSGNSSWMMSGGTRYYVDGLEMSGSAFNLWYAGVDNKSTLGGEAEGVEFFNSNGDFHQLGENGTIISTNPKLNGINTNVNKNGRGFYIPIDLPCYELWSELDARMNGNYNDYLTYLNSHHIVGVEKKMIWIPFELIYRLESAFLNNRGLPEWMSDANTGINAFGMSIGAKTELINYAIRNNYKSATSWSQFNKLRPTQKTWRITNTLGKSGARYMRYTKVLGYVGAGLTTTYSVVNAGSYYYNGGQDWQVGAKATLDIVMTGVGFLGPIGFVISATYFIVDANTDSFGGFGRTND